MRTLPAWTSATGPTEFTWTRDFGRGYWIIWRRGQPYAFIERNCKHPSHTQTYVERSVRILNGENP